jgi:hypothetical protein
VIAFNDFIGLESEAGKKVARGGLLSGVMGAKTDTRV